MALTALPEKGWSPCPQSHLPGKRIRAPETGAERQAKKPLPPPPAQPDAQAQGPWQPHPRGRSLPHRLHSTLTVQLGREREERKKCVNSTVSTNDCSFPKRHIIQMHRSNNLKQGFPCSEVVCPGESESDFISGCVVTSHKGQLKVRSLGSLRGAWPAPFPRRAWTSRLAVSLLLSKNVTG